MSLKEELTDFCYRLILTAAVALFLFLEIYNFYDPELIVKKNIISILLISFSFNVLLLIYHRIHLYIFPAIILVVTIFAFLLDENDVSMILESVLFKIVIICFAAFVIFLISDTSVAVNLIISLGLVIYMGILLIRGLDIYPSSPAFAVFYIAFSLTRAFRRTKDRNSARLRRYVAYLLPFLLIFPVMIMLLPKPEDPISWDWAKRIYDATVEKINELTHEWSLRFSSSDDDGLSVDFGYDDSMDYDNDSDGDTELMEISSDSRAYGSTYLKGEIFNTFEDGNWKNTLDTDKDYSDIDAFETYYGIVNFDRDVVHDIVKDSILKVKYLDLTTRIIFLPAKTLPVNKRIVNDTRIVAENEHLLFDDRKTYGTEYSLRYFQINYGSVPFLDYMNYDLKDNEEALKTVKTRDLNSAYSGLDMDDLQKYRDYVKEHYMSTPQVRDSVKKWVEAITRDAKTDYDKLKSIEYALSTYEYTLEGGNLPDYVETEGDYLDYFLLQKKSGYCVHYATAFCLIARYLGFPARVIQGYKVPLLSNKTAIVTNNDGHTWPEVYFEGKGWIAFEPTPGFGSERYGKWKIYSGKYSEVQEEASYYPSGEVPEVAEDTEYEKIHAERRVSGMLILIIASIVVISLILLVVTSLCISRIKRKRLSTEKLYAWEFNSLMAILKELKVEKNKGETLEEFSKRCAGALEKLHSEHVKTKTAENESAGKPDNDEEIKRKAHNKKQSMEKAVNEVIRTYERFLYGSLEITDTEMNEVAGTRERLLIFMRKVYGATYVIHRMRLYFAS